MPIVTLELPHLSSEAKKRLGDRILYAMQQEGIAPATIVMMFRPVSDDLYLDGILVEAEPAQAVPTPAFNLATATPPAAASLAASAEAPKIKSGRKSKSAVEASRDMIKRLLTERRSINSFEAQKAFEKADLDCSPALLRRLFQELEKEGVVARTGMKRGTRYVLRGPGPEKVPASIRLVKAEQGEE